MKASFKIISSESQTSDYDGSVTFSNQIAITVKSGILSQTRLVWCTTIEAVEVDTVFEDNTDNYIFQERESKSGNHYTKMSIKL